MAKSQEDTVTKKYHKSQVTKAHQKGFIEGYQKGLRAGEDRIVSSIQDLLGIVSRIEIEGMIEDVERRVEDVEAIIEGNGQG